LTGSVATELAGKQAAADSACPAYMFVLSLPTVHALARRNALPRRLILQRHKRSRRCSINYPQTWKIVARAKVGSLAGREGGAPKRGGRAKPWKPSGLI
jgi:hypothetical protein